MNTAIAVPGNTGDTFLVHFFGNGLADERYVVKRFKAQADGDIRPWPREAPAKGKGRRAKRVAATLKAVKEMRPTRTKIIVCTGLRTHGGLARPEGLEPPTPRFEAWYSIQLSYGRLERRRGAHGRSVPAQCTLARRVRTPVREHLALSSRSPLMLSETSS